VGDLDDEQMEALSRLGNDYRPTSAYERGKRYAYRLEHEFGGNISSLSDAENISRKIITRCINTARLPKTVGELLFKLFTGKEKQLLQQAEVLHNQKKSGAMFEADEVVSLLTEVLKESSAGKRVQSSRHQFAPGASVLYKGDKIVVNLDRSRISADCIEKIESILRELEK